MILIDPRRGSGELAKYFRPYDIEIDTDSYLEAGDFAFFGEGPDGTEFIGFERKVLSDFMTSKRDNRLHGFQLPGMSELYPNFSHLIIEGIWQAGQGNGQVEVHRGKGWESTRPAMAYRELDHFIAELAYKRGVFVERTANPAQTAAYIVSRYKFFNDQSWAQHNRTEKIYAPCNPIQGAGSGRGIRSGFIKRTVPSLEKQLMQVHGVGARDAYWLARRYVNMEEFMKASVVEIAEVLVERNDGKLVKMSRLGPAKARKLYDAERES